MILKNSIGETLNWVSSFTLINTYAKYRPIQLQLSSYLDIRVEIPAQAKIYFRIFVSCQYNMKTFYYQFIVKISAS